MPKLFQYLGIAVFFYSNEHDPIHVHGRKDGRESKIEITFKKGVATLRLRSVPGRQPLEGTELKDLETLVRAKADRIADRWTAFYIRKERITPETITRRLRKPR